jgi:polysaccharide pyruvyl transferase WcaK-like protein
MRPETSTANPSSRPTGWEIGWEIGLAATESSCVVWGGYGYGNTGDDLVLAVALHDLRQQGNHLQVLSPAPDQTRPCAPAAEVVLHPATNARALEKWFWRWTEYVETVGLKGLADALYRFALKHPTRITRQPAWLQALASASALHLVGGGYLTDRFDLRYFLRPLRLARSRGLPVVTSPIGLGPFRSARKAAGVVAALRGARLVVRDADSLRFCYTQGLRATEAPDDGFRWREVVDLPTVPANEAVLGVCIFSQYSSRWSEAVEAWWVACLQSLARALPTFTLEGFCFHTGTEMDYETTRRLFTRAGLNPVAVQPPHRDFRAAVRNLGRYQAILTTRFHAAVTAAGMQTPCVAAVVDEYYETKMRSVLKHAESPLSIVNPLRDPPGAPAEWLAPLLNQAGTAN